MSEPDCGDLMTVERFKENVSWGGFIDYDGHGYPVVDGKVLRKIIVQPSTVDQIPKEATHIMWYNR